MHVKLREARVCGKKLEEREKNKKVGANLGNLQHEKLGEAEQSAVSPADPICKPGSGFEFRFVFLPVFRCWVKAQVGSKEGLQRKALLEQQTHWFRPPVSVHGTLV